MTGHGGSGRVTGPMTGHVGGSTVSASALSSLGRGFESLFFCHLTFFCFLLCFCHFFCSFFALLLFFCCTIYGFIVFVLKTSWYEFVNCLWMISNCRLDFKKCRKTFLCIFSKSQCRNVLCIAVGNFEKSMLKVSVH